MPANPVVQISDEDLKQKVETFFKKKIFTLADTRLINEEYQEHIDKYKKLTVDVKSGFCKVTYLDQILQGKADKKGEPVGEWELETKTFSYKGLDDPKRSVPNSNRKVKVNYREDVKKKFRSQCDKNGARCVSESTFTGFFEDESLFGKFLRLFRAKSKAVFFGQIKKLQDVNQDNNTGTSSSKFETFSGLARCNADGTWIDKNGIMKEVDECYIIGSKALDSKISTFGFFDQRVSIQNHASKPQDKSRPAIFFDVDKKINTINMQKDVLFDVDEEIDIAYSAHVKKSNGNLNIGNPNEKTPQPQDDPSTQNLIFDSEYLKTDCSEGGSLLLNKCNTCLTSVTKKNAEHGQTCYRKTKISKVKIN